VAVDDRRRGVREDRSRPLGPVPGLLVVRRSGDEATERRQRVLGGVDVLEGFERRPPVLAGVVGRAVGGGDPTT